MPAAMRLRLLRLVTWGAVLALALALGACNKDEFHIFADTEGVYVDAGPLTYQVQDSRELNPASPEDKEYFRGLPPGTPQPGAEAEWFGVWLRVQNQSEAPVISSRDITIVDTLGTVYRPIPMAPSNPLIYKPQTMPPGSLYPPVTTLASTSGPQAATLLLFQLKTNAYQNRPLELKIVAAPGETPPEASVSLDL